MTSKFASNLTLSLLFLFTPALIAQEQYEKSQITIGNGERNSIQVKGMRRLSGEATYSQVRVNGKNVSTFRANTTAITFPEVTIEKAGWVVLHPVIAGKPDGNVVAGFTYLEAGTNKDVTIQISNLARAEDKFLVMLHSDVDQDRVFDFVFIEDGINVEDKAVFEGNKMIANIIALSK